MGVFHKHETNDFRGEYEEFLRFMDWDDSPDVKRAFYCGAISLMASLGPHLQMGIDTLDLAPIAAGFLSYQTEVIADSIHLDFRANQAEISKALEQYIRAHDTPSDMEEVCLGLMPMMIKLRAEIESREGNPPACDDYGEADFRLN